MADKYQNISEILNFNLTETLAQYVSIKQESPNCLLLFQVGEFYEAYLDDAITLSKVCSLYLTTRKIKQGSIVMAGIPIKSLNEYLIKLLNENYKVIVCAQKEENGKITREIKRIYSKGMVFEDNFLNSSKSNFIASIFQEKDKCALAKADISTGDFSFCEGNLDEILNELRIIEPVELLVPVKTREIGNFQIVKDPEPDIEADFSNFNITLVKKSSFNTNLVKGNTLGHKCANAILEYSNLTNRNFKTKLCEIKKYCLSDYLMLDENAIKNLELFKTRENKFKGSFLWAIDKTQTPMGKRLLCNWVKKPLRNIEEIKKRQNAIDEYKNSNSILDIQNTLKNCHDIKRLWGKLTNKTLSLKDFISLKITLRQLTYLEKYLKDFKNPLIKLDEDITSHLKDLYEVLENNLYDEENEFGEIFKTSSNSKLYILKNEIEKTKQEIKKYEENEQEKTGIKNLKVLENRVFGYFIEIGNKNLSKVPPYFKIRQNLSNTSRFVTDELVILNEKINSLMYQKITIEKEIIETLKDLLIKESNYIYEFGNKLSTIDVINSFYEISKDPNYAKPQFKEGKNLYFKGVKHPLGTLIIKNYVPNDFIVDDEKRFKLLTGPNMAGKSTYMKSIALNIILAQVGLYTCDTEHSTYIFDKIFFHSKSEDYLNEGKSTFMQEMYSAKKIIENATEKSFIIFDELGIGTSTSDGVKLAFGISKYIIEKINAVTIFATHFHKLRKLKEKFNDKVQNLMIGDVFDNDKKTFNREVKDGFLSESYGLNVARMAKLPDEILKHAQDFEV